VSAGQRALSLTFDDGPHRVRTAGVLRALDHAGVSAPFFVATGAVRRLDRSVRALAAAGHDLELHCDPHIRHSELREDEVERDTRAALERLAEARINTTLWRTPWGVCTPATFRVGQRVGLQVAGWDIDPHDWRGTRFLRCSNTLASGSRAAASF
jgi:peptidoglycan-N-acetylglucosamine deacetylase